jgi:hypothetical protein
MVCSDGESMKSLKIGFSAGQPWSDEILLYKADKQVYRGNTKMQKR